MSSSSSVGGFFQTGNPNPAIVGSRTGMASLYLSPPSVSLRFGIHSCRRPTLSVDGLLRLNSLPLSSTRRIRRRSISSFAAASDDGDGDLDFSKTSDTEEGKEDSHQKLGGEESEEAWKQTLASFKEQALQMQSVSKEAFEVYLTKALVVLRDTSEKLKIQAEKAKEDLSVIAKELSEEGKVYLSTAADNSPEPVKDIVETFAFSADELKDVSNVLDFYVGIPYGGLLFLGGFLSFMLTGSISAIRFGVILGGALLALGIYSLRSYRRGESSPLAIKGQAAIATILFLREVRLLFERHAFTSYFAILLSGTAVAFYVYRMAFYNGQTEGTNFEAGTDN